MKRKRNDNGSNRRSNFKQKLLSTNKTFFTCFIYHFNKSLSICNDLKLKDLDCSDFHNGFTLHNGHNPNFEGGGADIRLSASFVDTVLPDHFGQKVML